MSSKFYFTEISLIRPILIFSIIIGHAFAIFTDSAWWPLPLGMHTNDVLRCVNPIMISFALQTFVFVSGFLFAYKSDALSTCNSNVIRFILSKFKRIYIPSIIFSFLYILSFDSFSIASIYDILNGAGHLWFLPMLFWCYTFGVISIPFFIFRPTLVKLILLGIISILSLYLPDYFRIASGLHYFIYFVLGAWVFKFKEVFQRFTFDKSHTMIAGWVFILLLCLIKCYLAYFYDGSIPLRLLSFLKILTNSVLGVIGSITIYFSSDYIIKKFPNIKPVRGDIWYGMYIYHQFCMVYLYYHTSLPEYFGNNAVFPILLTTLIVSFVLVFFTLKTKWGRWLIG